VTALTAHLFLQEHYSATEELVSRTNNMQSPPVTGALRVLLQLRSELELLPFSGGRVPSMVGGTSGL
jgi:hypothetical protein